ncbi:MAG: aldolase [Burkholderiaceae bacterium]
MSTTPSAVEDEAAIPSIRPAARSASDAVLRDGRRDLSIALRGAALLGLNEGVCNHFSLEVGHDRYLINPQGLHWREVRPDDILLIDGSGRVLEGRHTLEPTAFFIHSWIHRINTRARCVMHTHMPYATALTLVEGGRLEWCNQNTLRFHGRVAYDDHYNGLALDEAEGRRIASMVGSADVVFMASHGVTVIGQSVAWAFDDLYYLERACMHQALAIQLAAGRPLRRVPEALCAQVSRQIAGERQQSDLFFAAVARLLDGA